MSGRIPGCDALGLRPMITSDGPSGVRGTTLDEGNPPSCLPCPSALGATWDPGLVRELAAALGAEARSKGVDILLAPTINLMRTPLAGRGFECFSEDPELTARIAVAYVTGVQSAGVAATVKHYVGNDSETERWTYDARIAERVLRELYLIPFEACVREAGAAVVMAAYNVVNGSRMTEHARLLRSVLKGEWGFGGLVTSDWDATRSTVATAVGGLDLAMPHGCSPCSTRKPGSGPGRRACSPCRSAGRRGTCGCRSASGPANASRRRYELDLVAVPVLQVGRVVVEAARVRVAVAEQQPPSVLRRLVGELVHLFPGGDMEGQMVHSGAAPVVPAGHPVGRLLQDDVEATCTPALPLGPLDVGLVAQLDQ